MMRQIGLVSSSALVATMVMELSYLYLGLALLRKGLGLSHLAISLIMALYLLSPVLKKLAANLPTMCRRSSLVPATLAMTIASAVTLMAVWQVLRAGYPIFGLFLQIGFLGLAWWLGNSLAWDELSYNRISVRFQVGITVLLVFAGARKLTPVIIFSIMALFALALSRWESSVMDSRGVLRPVSYRHLIAGSIAILLPCALMFLLLSPEVARAIVSWLSMVAAKIGKFFQRETVLPASPPRSFDLFAGCQPAAEKAPLARQEPLPPEASSEISPILIWLFAFALFLALLIVIHLTIRKIRARSQTRHVPPTEIAIKAIWVNILRELAEFLRRIGTWLRYFLWSLLDRWRSRLVSARQEAPVSPRALYRLLLRWAAGRGLPRLPSQTAGEYLNILSQRFPRESRELQLITGVYVQARYSPRAVTSEDFEAAFRAWQSVSGTK